MIERTTLFKTTLGLLLLAACTGCTNGDDDSDDDGGGQLFFLPTSEDATSGGLTLSTAEFSFSDVSLEPCTVDAALLDTQDFSISLFSAPPPGVLFVSAVTDFCGVTTALAPAVSTTLPELVGSTVLFEGALADATPFTLKSTLTTTLGFTHDPALDAMNLVIGVDFNAWFANVDVTDAEQSDGSVLIDADHNPDVLAAFDAAVGAGLALYDDANGDRMLTGDELTPVATATPE